MAIDIKFKCDRFSIPDLVGATIWSEELLFSLIRLSAQRKYSALIFDEKTSEFRVNRLELPNAMARPDYSGFFVGFQERELYFACFIPVKLIVEQLVTAEEQLGLKEIYLRINGNWMLIYNKGGYVSDETFKLQDGEINFVPMNGSKIRLEEIEWES